MIVYNLIWGFTTGGGIDKCYLQYHEILSVNHNSEVYSACVNIKSLNTNLYQLTNLGIKIIEINSRSDFSWLNKIANNIREVKPDIFFTHGFNGAIMALFLRYFKGVKLPLVTTYHGLYHAPTSKKIILKPIYNSLARFVYKYISKQTICVENMSRNYLIRKGVPKNKLSTVHNGIKLLNQLPSFKREKVNQIKNELLIISVSRINKVKGLNYLLEAIAKIKNKTEILFKYIMIGDGPELDNLKSLANELGISDKVHFVGHKNNVLSFLESADIFVLPSLSECHSISLLEAMRSGKAIIATDVGGNRESIRDQKEGLLIPSKNVNALSIALLKLLEDSNLRKQYANSAKARFENNFTEQVMKRKLLKILKS